MTIAGISAAESGTRAAPVRLPAPDWAEGSEWDADPVGGGYATYTRTVMVHEGLEPCEITDEDLRVRLQVSDCVDLQPEGVVITRPEPAYLTLRGHCMPFELDLTLDAAQHLAAVLVEYVRLGRDGGRVTPTPLVRP